MNEMKSLTLNGKTYDSFQDQEAREKLNKVQSGGITDNAATLLISVLRNAVYTSDQAVTITALEKALAENASSGGSGGGDTGGTDVILVSISASYTGGKVPVGTSVDNLKGVSVMAMYSDGSFQVVTDYTLSGVIKNGSSTITVSYGGKSTTVTVTGYIDTSDGYVSDGLEFRLDAIRNTGTVNGKGQQLVWPDVSGNNYETYNTANNQWFYPKGTYLEAEYRGACQVRDYTTLLSKMSDGFTVEVVYQPTSAIITADRPLFSLGNGKDYWLLNTSGLFRVLGSADLYGTPVSDATKINHITLVYDGATLKMYHDGVLNTEHYATFDISTGDDLEFFGNSDHADQYAYTGNAARIYTRALSEDEILANYNNDIARFGTVNGEVA